MAGPGGQTTFLDGSPAGRWSGQPVAEDRPAKSCAEFVRNGRSPAAQGELQGQHSLLPATTTEYDHRRPSREIPRDYRNMLGGGLGITYEIAGRTDGLSDETVRFYGFDGDGVTEWHGVVSHVCRCFCLSSPT